MSKIRSIRPELWTDEAFVELTPMARLTYLGMANFCDDRGVMPTQLRTLKMLVFPGDSVTVDEMAGYVSEMIALGLIDVFEVEGQRYWVRKRWGEDQKIDRPNPRYPPPPQQRSNSVPTAFQQRSNSDATPQEGKGREGNRNGREGSGGTARPHEEGEIEEISTANAVPVSDEMTATTQKIQDWAEANAATIRNWIDMARYDVQKFGPAWHQIPKFCAHYLQDIRAGDRAALLRDPVGFFQRCFPRWLTNAASFDKPAANGQSGGKTSGWKAKQEPATYSPPPASNTDGQPLGKTWVAHWVSVNMPGVEVSDGEMRVLSRCTSEEALSRTAKKMGLQDKAPPMEAAGA